jgi:hypothetical protein
VFLLEILFDALVEVVLEVFFALFRALDEDQGAWPLAVFLFVIVGLLVGGATGLWAPGRVLAQGPFRGVSLVVVPALLGGFMELWGNFLNRFGRRTSNLATWYGGLSMGLGLAAGRLVGLQFSAAAAALG